MTTGLTDRTDVEPAPYIIDLTIEEVGDDAQVPDARERARQALEALADLDLSDTAPEPTRDDVAVLASLAVEGPMDFVITWAA